jgi:hypothetical protein
MFRFQDITLHVSSNIDFARNGNRRFLYDIIFVRFFGRIFCTNFHGNINN